MEQNGRRPCPGCGAVPATAERYCSDDCKPRCSVDGCESPQRKRTWCGSHYSQWQRTGEQPKPFGYKWAESAPCLVCGKPPAPTFRQFCSSACSVLYRLHDGQVPTHVECIACGVEISLTERGKGGQRRKACTKLCRPCRQDYRKYKLSARELARRDGTDCGICGEPVDMDLRRSESYMCPSVDHVIPRALGGTHEPENLQLAHLRCNQLKGDLRGKTLEVAA